MEELAKLLKICETLDALESDRVKLLTTKQRESLEELAARLRDIRNSLGDLKKSADADLCKDMAQCVALRIEMLVHKFKVSFKASALDEAPVEISPENMASYIRQYREDIRTPFVWAGLTEANFIATHLMRIRCHIYTVVNGRYRRVITIGDPTAALLDRHLLHTGNHYEVLTVTPADGDVLNRAAHVLQTTPNGNCLYESILIANREPSADARPGLGAIQMLRQAVSTRLSDGEITAAILAILWQGDYGGLGPKMDKLVETLAPSLKASVARGDEVDFTEGAYTEALAGAWTPPKGDDNTQGDANPTKKLANPYKNKHFGADRKAAQHSHGRDVVWGLEERAIRLGLAVPGAQIFKFTFNIGTDGSAGAASPQTPYIRVDSIGSGAQHSHPFPALGQGLANHRDYVIERIITYTNDEDRDGLTLVARYLRIIGAARNEYGLSANERKKLKKLLPKCLYWNP